MNEITININNLNKKYKNILAVKNLNFKISKGQTIGLLGPNGCGKSTTIGMLLGLIKPTTGNVIINGQNMESNRTNLLQKMNFISPYIELPKKLTIEDCLFTIENLQAPVEGFPTSGENILFTIFTSEVNK